MAKVVGVAKGDENHSGFLETVRERYKVCLEADKSNRDRAREALAFRNLEQWDPKLKRDRENDTEGARPCLVVDKLNQHVQQVVNDQRQNRPQIKVRPVDDKGDPEVAKILDGIIRHIHDASHADIAYDTGFEHAVDGGFGYWRILTEYCDPMSFEQDLRIKRIRNRFSVYLDPERQEPDGSDAKYGFILYKLSKDKFKAEYGDVAKEALEDFDFQGKEFAEWYGDDWVLIAEYYWIDKKKTQIVMLADAEGTVMTKEEYESLQPPPGAVKPAIQAERETEIPQVRWRTVTGTKVLKTTEWPGYCIPIVEVVGNELDIEGKVHRSGMLHAAMDAQRVDNYATSAFIEQVALAPRAPWVAEETQIEGHENEWRTANRRNISVLKYKARTVDGAIIPAPTRLPPPGIPLGWQAVLMQAEHNIQAAMGRYDASLGEESNEKSGKAIIARQRKGDIGAFHFQDNQTRSLRHTGRILLEVLPKFYDTRRVARIIGEDGTPDSVTVDPDLADDQGNPIAYRETKNEAGKVIERIYNLGFGKYDVTVVAGPGYATRRLEAAEAMLEISRGNNDFLMNMGDIVFKSQDWPGADQIAERFKKMLPPGMAEKDEDQEEPVIQTPGGPMPISQASELMASMAQQLEQAGEHVKAAGDVGKMQQAVKDEAGRVDAGKAALQAQAAAIEAAKRELALQEQLASERLKNERLEAEAALQAKAAAETAPQETSAPKASQSSQPVNVIDSSVAGPLEQVAQAMAMVAQAMQGQNERLEKVMAASMMPRKSRLVMDANGMPVESVSEPMGMMQ
jgi:hypothetical protein